MSNTAQKPKAKGMDRFFDFIERTGNKLPTPFMLFVYLTIATAHCLQFCPIWAYL